jgi:MFS family permease
MNNQSSSLFRFRPFLFLWLCRFLWTLATLAQSVTIGWQVYTIARQTSSIEHSSFLVGMVGLAQFLPLFALTLIAGETVDRYDRRKILLITASGTTFQALGLLFVTTMAVPSLTAIFILAGVFGGLRAFASPASTALGPMLIPRELMPKAVALGSLAVQGGMILGPWLGGVLCAISPTYAYMTTSVLFGFSLLSVYCLRGNTKPDHKGGKRLDLIKEGLAYVWSNKIVFGAISLDLCAVLLGGATALLPVYARDILHIGPQGFGLLRSGPAIGGCIGAFWLGRRPLMKKVGTIMLSAVGVFGVATIIFGLSQSVILSMMALVVLGASDAISVYVRQSLVQIVTPDAMRGRVSAVSTMFISASNELGEFESGLVARLIGPVGSAVFGGVGSILVTLTWAKLFPALRKADELKP